jgi:hypothetical protein
MVYRLTKRRGQRERRKEGTMNEIWMEFGWNVSCSAGARD